ncbi:hypothetical protein RMSM_02081 [Rhodopirellula maiorica SM1]|uniref:Uncharacterized protein n=1 Tax=Rhodopirellula maiorica SM1 TaxID=1265738 RepID=M5S478_9BACT|nr:hypothetical protein RMSM_02081 [Rhodopirellula maiorica SM1]
MNRPQFPESTDAKRHGKSFATRQIAREVLGGSRFKAERLRLHSCKSQQRILFPAPVFPIIGLHFPR